MKTGRVRKKAEPGAQGPTTPQPQPTVSTPQPQPTVSTPKPHPTVSAAKLHPTVATAQPKPKIPTWAILAAMSICFALAIACLVISGGRPKAEQWIKAEQADGVWTTTVTVLGPQAPVQGCWQTDCTADRNCAVQPGTCVMATATAYREVAVKEYDELAYNIYWEETWDQVYEAQEADFVVIQLGSDDRWEGDLHTVRQERLKKDTCEYTEYTVWVTDPQDKSQEIEVYLSECEIWDHVTVTRKEYEERSWCQCETTTLVKIGEQSEQGSGLEVRWPQPSVPRGGRADQSFAGQVVFRGDDYSITVSSKNLAEYQRYLTGQYYIGVRDGQAMQISPNPPQK
jgi:hypothetical protein